MKNIQFGLEDEEYAKINLIKRDRSWRSFLMDMVEQQFKEEVKNEEDQTADR